MQSFSSAVSAYAVNALWQAPVIVLAGEAAVRLLGGVRAKFIHIVWLGCFLLSLTMPGLSLLHEEARPIFALEPGGQSMPLVAQGLENVQHNSHEASGRSMAGGLLSRKIGRAHV